ncbi:MAG: M14 family zinc carboxypeptidase, partial [bacterium]
MRKATTTLALTVLAALTVLGAYQMTYANDMLVRVYFDNFEHLKKVVSQFEDVASWGGRRYADISLPQERFSELEALAPNYEILIVDIQREIADLGILGVGSAYHTYEEAYAEMDSVADANPTICMVQSIGQSIESRQIWAMKISDNVGTTEGEPRILYLGNHHAREYITVEIPLYLMYYFVDNYGSDPRVTDLVDNREIW